MNYKLIIICLKLKIVHAFEKLFKIKKNVLFK